MTAKRRLWFLVPSHYTDDFSGATYPYCSMVSGSSNQVIQGHNAVNTDLDVPMVTDGTLANPFYLYLNGIGDVNGVYFEAADWDTSGYYRISMQTSSISSDARATISYGVGPVIATVSNGAYTATLVDAIPVVTNESFLIAYSGQVSHSQMRLRFEAVTPSAHISIPNIWIGQVYQMDAMYSIGNTRSASYLERSSEKSASGVPITQQKVAQNYGTTLRSFSLTFEWIDESQLADLLNIYDNTQGFRPFKMILKNDGTAYTEPEAYSVAFSADLAVTEVADGYYTVSVSLAEHN